MIHGGLTSSLLSVVNIVLPSLATRGMTLWLWFGPNVPSPVDFKEIVELSLVEATATRAVYFLDSTGRGEHHLVRAHTHNGAILLMKPVDVGRSAGVELVPFENPRGDERDPGPGYAAQR